MSHTISPKIWPISNVFYRYLSGAIRFRYRTGGNASQP
jgi:hypothetical protein